MLPSQAQGTDEFSTTIFGLRGFLELCFLFQVALAFRAQCFLHCSSGKNPTPWKIACEISETIDRVASNGGSFAVFGACVFLVILTQLS